MDLLFIALVVLLIGAVIWLAVVTVGHLRQGRELETDLYRFAGRRRDRPAPAARQHDVRRAA